MNEVLTPQKKKELEQKGLFDFNFFRKLGVGKLAQLLEITEDDATQFLLELKNQMSNWNNQENDDYVPTGFVKLDEAIGGGLCSGTLNLLYGSYNSGKTQLCHQIITSTYQREGATMPIIFFDSENTFRPQRLLEISGNNSNLSEFLDYVKVIKITGYIQLQRIMDTYNDLFPIPGLLIIDSITEIFQKLETDGESRAKVIKKLINFLQHLKKLSKINGTTVVLTSHIRSTNASLPYESVYPVYSDVLDKIIDSWILLQKMAEGSTNEDRTAFIIKNPKFMNARVPFTINNDGIY